MKANALQYYHNKEITPSKLGAVPVHEVYQSFWVNKTFVGGIFQKEFKLLQRSQ